MNDASSSQIPSALETQLLRAALLEREPALAAYRGWKAAVDIDSLDGGSQRMLPLLADNLARIGYEDDLSGFLHGHRRQSLAMNAQIIGTARPALRALAAADVDVMVLKGTALVASGLSELGLRPIGDVDVLVRPEDRGRAIDVLTAEGWEMNAYPAWYVKRVHARDVPAWVMRKGRIEIDLHWSALHLVRDPAAELPLWARSTAGDLGGEPVRVPSIEDQAMHAWLHAAEHNPIPPLRWAADALIAIRAGEPFDWDMVVETATAQAVLLQTRAATGYLARALDAPMPPAANKALRKTRVTPLQRYEHAARNRPPAERTRSQVRVIALQDHRRQSLESLRRSPLAGALELRRGPTDDLAGAELHDLRAEPLNLDRDHDPLDTLLHGWSFPEQPGRWTDGPSAKLAVKIPPGVETLLVAELSAFVGVAGRRQRVTISVNGRRYATLRFGDSDLPLASREVRIPVLPSTDGTAVIGFRIGSPRSPSSLGLPADERQLGVLLRSLRLA